MILCNGGPGCDDYLGPVAAMIDDLCEVVRFEPRGCGRSDRDARYDFQTTIDDVEWVRRGYGLARTIVAGHSAGVDLALGYTMKYPAAVCGIVGISGGRLVDDREWGRVYHENLERCGEDQGGKVFDADPEVNRIGNASWKQYIKRPTLLRDLANIKAPATFINAGDDIRPNWPTMQIAALLSEGRYVEIQGARHFIWLSHPEELRRELRNAVRNMTYN